MLSLSFKKTCIFAQELMLSDINIISGNHWNVWETIYVSIRSTMVKLNMAHTQFRILGGVKKVKWTYIWSHAKILHSFQSMTRARGKIIYTLLLCILKTHNVFYSTSIQEKSRINFKITWIFNCGYFWKEGWILERCSKEEELLFIHIVRIWGQ